MGAKMSIQKGKENYERFYSNTSKKYKYYYKYEYRTEDGKLFSIIAPTLRKCRKFRDAWLERKIIIQASLKYPYIF